LNKKPIDITTCRLIHLILQMITYIVRNLKKSDYNVLSDCLTSTVFMGILFVNKC